VPSITAVAPSGGRTQSSQLRLQKGTVMKITSQIEEARKLHGDSVEKMEEWDAKLQALPEDASDEELRFTKECFDKSKREAQRCAETMDRLVSIAEARQIVPLPESTDDSERRTVDIKVGNEPMTYRQNGTHSFFMDMAAAKAGTDEVAAKRLHQHMHEMRVEQRSVTAASGGAGFIPPIYLADQWIQLPRAKRPFADKIPKIPLGDTGLRMDFPRVGTGATVAIQASETNTVSNQDLVTETYSASVRTIAGYVDLTIQLAQRSAPGFDEVVMRDLMRAYDTALDAQLLNGTGTGQHTGIRNVSGVNTSTFSSGTADAAIKKIYDGAQLIATNAYEQATVVVMHPRRAAWFASFTGSVFPLLQQGGLFQAVGTQDQGFAGTIAGLPVITDPNILTNTGTNTNQDELYVLALDELMLAEGPLQTRVDEYTLSNSLQVRIVLYAFSAFASGRIPKALTVVSGAGLTPPTF
jgi:HK97 family phage major capsid protein